MIIMIHIGYSYSLPVLRIAVPVFFIISSFFFFERVNGMKSESERVSYLKHFIARASKLYLFWFIALSPLTIKLRGFLQMDFLQIIENLVFRVLLDSTFPASWFIAAYIIDISLVYMLRKRFSLILGLGLVIYIYCCLVSNYYNVFKFLKFYGNSGYSICISFPVGIFFVSVGRYLALNRNYSFKTGVIGTVVGLILLAIESNLIHLYDWGIADDCYLSLIILAPSVFILVKHFLISIFLKEIA